MTALVLALLMRGAASAGGETLLVVEKAAESIGAYDPETGRALWSVRVGTKPHETDPLALVSIAAPAP